jgi:hypothetical protein
MQYRLCDAVFAPGYLVTHSETMPDAVLPNNQEDREVYLRECGAGAFVDALKERQRSGDVLVQALTPDWTTDVIYVALEFIRESGGQARDTGLERGPEAALDALRRGG